MNDYRPEGWPTVTPRIFVAEVMESPVNTPYGDRRAIVRDPWGNVWQIATRSGG